MSIQKPVATETLGAAGGQGIAGVVSDIITAIEGSGGGHTHLLAVGATDVTATAAELNISDGLAASTADLNATTNFEQTLSSSTTVLTVTNGTIDFDIASHDGTNGLKLGGTLVTTSAAELNYADGLTAGTATASKLVLLDASKDFDFGTGDVGCTDMTAAGNVQGVNVTATGDVITDEIIAKTADTPVKVTNGAYTVPIAYTPDAAGTATLDVSNSNLHTITMPAGNITIAISQETTGQIFLVEITQDGTGSRLVTWFAGISWAGQSAPTLTTTASRKDTFAFRCTAADTYDGYVVGLNI